ncbi:MAG: hypothetical protein U0002_20550 [Thermoanaerobaculia bacterium]
MRRATITLSDDLEQQLTHYLSGLAAAPSLNALVEAALRSFLEQQELERWQYRPARAPFRITPAEQGSGETDISVDPDRHLAEILEGELRRQS